jgi:hypothetical protein
MRADRRDMYLPATELRSQEMPAIHAVRGLAPNLPNRSILSAEHEITCPRTGCDLRAFRRNKRIPWCREARPRKRGRADEVRQRIARPRHDVYIGRDETQSRFVQVFRRAIHLARL